MLGKEEGVQSTAEGSSLPRRRSYITTGQDELRDGVSSVASELQAITEGIGAVEACDTGVQATTFRVIAC